MELFKKEIIDFLKKETKLREIALEIPPEPIMGDYAFPCFVLAKNKQNPGEIAEKLKEKVPLKGMIKNARVIGPYLNFFMNDEKIAKDVLKKIYKEKEMYGSAKTNKSALIEHTSVNPNASPHVGRARNALIGDSIARVLKFKGYKTEVHYFVNDVGKQIAMLVLGCGNKKIKFENLLETYIKINKEVEKNPNKEKEIFELLNKLEKGDKKIKDRFRDVVGICIKGQSEILKELGINYDFFDYESDYLWKKETNDILKKLEKTKKLFTDEEGRKVLNQKEFNLAMKAPYLVLTRADGTSLYPLRDIAYTIDKIKKTENNFVVLGEDHKLYFEQLKAALSILDYKAPKVIHYSFVLLKEGKMSTRKGNLVLLEDFMKETLEKSKKEILKRNKKIDKKSLEKLSRTIGYGSLKYSILKVSPEKNVVFEWEQALSFEGESAPYIQYAYARICSIIRKYGKKVDNKINFGVLKEKEEIEIIKKLSEFPEAVDKTLNLLKPNVLANYAYSVAKGFNEFYHKHNILKEKEELKKARLLMAYCVKEVLENGLRLLGIEAPERM